MWKRIAISLLSFAIIFVVSLQTAPQKPVMTSDAPMSMAGSMAGMDMSDCDHHSVPCKDMTPACFGSMGCMSMIGLPAPLLSAATSFEWSAISYPMFEVALAGRTIAPELFPPILHA